MSFWNEPLTHHVQVILVLSYYNKSRYDEVIMCSADMDTDV